MMCINFCRLKLAEKTLAEHIEKLCTEMESLRLEAKQLLGEGQKQAVSFGLKRLFILATLRLQHASS